MSDQKPIVVLGAGPAGLTAARILIEKGRKVVVLEKEPVVGGISSSERWNGFIVEFGPHTYHVKRDRIDGIIRDHSPENLPLKKRVTRMLIRDKYYDYPLRFWQLFRGLNPLFSVQMIVDFLFTSLKFKFFPRPDDSFEIWGIKRFGKTLYKLCFGQYTERVWGIPAARLSERLASQKLHKLNLKDVLIKLLGGKGQEQATYWEDFLYPEEGMGVVFEKMAALIREGGGEVWTNSVPTVLTVHNGRVVAVRVARNGKETVLECSDVISTIPLAQLSRLLKSYLEGEVLEAGLSLHNRSLVLVNLIFDVPIISSAHWVYLLDPSFRFNRFCEQKNLLIDKKPYLKTLITFELCCNFGDPIWRSADETLKEMALEDARFIDIIDTSRAGPWIVKRVKDAYPIYDLGFESRLERLLLPLSRIPNLYSTGRQGLFLNTDMHDSMEMGLMTAEASLSRQESRLWYEKIISYLHFKTGGANR